MVLSLYPMVGKGEEMINGGEVMEGTIEGNYITANQRVAWLVLDSNTYALGKLIGLFGTRLAPMPWMIKPESKN